MDIFYDVNPSAPIGENVMGVRRGDWAVEWYNAGEGIDGDYNPDDPEDVNLLRFDVYHYDKDGNKESVEDGSYCTQVPASTDETTLKKLLIWLLDMVSDKSDGNYISRKWMEEWSWISPEWVQNHNCQDEGNYTLHTPAMGTRFADCHTCGKSFEIKGNS